MMLARAIHFDESDMNVYHVPARTGEWCIPGGFEFSNWTEDDLAGKARQAFTNGWLGVETFGRVTFVATTRIEQPEIDQLVTDLAQHFVAFYGAPSPEAATPVALEEINQMLDLCAEHAPNTVMTIARDLSEAGVRESIRIVDAQDASLDMLAQHGS